MIRYISAYFNTLLESLNLPNLSLEGRRFDPKSTDTYVRAKLFPNEPENVELGINMQRFSGLMQIDVFAPRLNGLTTVNNITDQILAAVERGSFELTKGRIIILTCWTEALREEPTYIHSPVFIRWESYSR